MARRFVRVHGGDDPRIEDVSDAERITLERGLGSAGLPLDGGLEMVPTSWIVPLNEVAHVFVPFPVRLVDGCYPRVAEVDGSIRAVPVLGGLAGY
jgi:hypothetical protein